MPTERIYKQGLADPRTGGERIAGLINKAFQPKAVKQQGRRYDDSPTRRAVNRRKAQRGK